LQLAEQEVSIRMEQMRHIAQLHETKFKTSGREVPAELKQQMEELVTLEQEVSAAMATKQEELLHLQADRAEYQTELNIVTTWLTQALEQLEEGVMDVTDATIKHEVSTCGGYELKALDE